MILTFVNPAGPRDVCLSIPFRRTVND